VTSMTKRHEKTTNNSDPILNFLLFSFGDAIPKVVPLELIARLEEINSAKIEKSNNKLVYQYRNSLMYLYNATNKEIPERDIIPIIVFTNRNKVMGLIVDNIIDIVEDHMHVHNSIPENGFLGNIIIQGKTCDLIDISYYFGELFSDDDYTNNAENGNIIPQI